MRLLLSMLSWPDGANPELREIDDGLAIGRGRNIKGQHAGEWTLQDPSNPPLLSRLHCVLTPLGDGWRVTDFSLNGTFINESSRPIGREQSYELHDGDRIHLGAYVIEVRYQAPAHLADPMGEIPPFGAPHPAQPFPAGHDWQAPAGAHFAPGFDFPTFDAQPFGSPGARGQAASVDFIGQTSDNHSPAMSDAWLAPPPGRIVIPDDWDLEEPLTPDPPPPQPPTPSQPPAAPPASPPKLQAVMAPSSLPLPPIMPTPPTLVPDDVWGDDDFPPAPTPSPTPSPTPRPAPATPAPVTPAPVTPGPVTPGQVAPAQIASARVSPEPIGDSALLAAFLRGAGLRDAGEMDPVAMMEAVGKTLRVTVDRLREVHAARATIKREFRINATMFRAEGNNPIKFSANVEAALRSLFDGKQPPERAVGQLLDDIRLHELAMIAAMRDAVNGLLAELDPAPLRAAEPGLSSMLPVQRRARAFEQYEALHARTVQAMADDFDSVFGKAFARAYERVALDDENQPKRTRR